MKRNVRRVWTSAKALVLTAVMALGFAQGAQAQDRDASVEVNKNFTVCPLNVDGLPEKILGITINSDGKGEAGAAAIGEYLKNKGIDVVALSEDFNYHNALVNALGDGYKVGNYRGGISQDNYQLNVSFNTDGLEFLTKTPTTFYNELWTEWNQKNGKFSNGSDELIRKGFRYYTVDLGDGALVDFYIMHMDADVDAEDIAARASQWEQLCNAIKTRNSGRPVIVMGDTNSRYTRDDIYGKFINNLTSDYDVTDAWVQLCQNGKAPEFGSNALVIPDAEKLNSESYKKYEIVDKVIYLNPKNATYKLNAQTIDFDADNYQKDGSLLGDHVPVIVNFNVSGEVITKFEPVAANEWWRGENLTNIGDHAYLFNVDYKHFVTTDAKPVVDDINNATLWDVNDADGESDARRTFAYGNYRIKLYNTLQLTELGTWIAEIAEKNNHGAANFNIDASTTTDGAVVLRHKGLKDTRYFGITNGEYDAKKSNNVTTDWLLISETQKETYLKYKDLYDEAKGFLTLDGLDETLKSELENVLTETANSNYNTSAKDIESLEEILKKFFYVKTVTTAKYASICLPWNAKVPEGVTMYYATKYNDQTTPNYVHLEKFEGNVIPGNTGFLVYADVNEATPFTFYATFHSADAYPTDNILMGTVNPIKNEDLSFDKYNYMMLSKQDGIVGFYRLNNKSTNYIPDHCAYILRSKSGSVSPANFASFDFGGSTAISGVYDSANAKVVAVYGVNGELRSTMQHGLNIVKMSDGTVKKVLVK